jgi:hypothetical protein
MSCSMSRNRSRSSSYSRESHHHHSNRPMSEKESRHRHQLREDEVESASHGNHVVDGCNRYAENDTLAVAIMLSMAAMGTLKMMPLAMAMLLMDAMG